MLEEYDNFIASLGFLAPVLLWVFVQGVRLRKQFVEPQHPHLQLQVFRVMPLKAISDFCCAVKSSRKHTKLTKNIEHLGPLSQYLAMDCK